MAQSTKSWSQLVSSGSDHSGPVVCPSDFASHVSFNDIMSEQLALEFSLNNSLKQAEVFSSADSIDALLKAGISSAQLSQMENLKEGDCSNDEVLAKLLQHELDLEHDRELKMVEKQYNANSKVTLSFDNHRRVKNEDLNLSDLEDETYHEYGEDSKHWDFFEESEKSSVKIGRQGFTVNNGKITTKHDPEMNKSRNACKVMEFESDIRTGDGGGFPMKLSNNVYNALKVHSISEGKRMARLHEKKEKSSAEKAVDEKSRILLFKLINRGILETINGVISTGKESIVLHSRGENPDKGITSCEVAIKVFKTTITEFQNRVQYIIGDPILEQTGKLSRQNPKLTIPLWAEKEMHNLNRMRKSGIACPTVLLQKQNILVMTFIGQDGRPAPTLKRLIYSEELFNHLWQETVSLMVKLYQECNMVHADLSEYNLMWHQGKLWCIDVSQAVRATHPMAYRFLWRDCVNICKFFSRLMSELHSPAKLFSLITGKQFSELQSDEQLVELFDKMENYEKNIEKLTFNDDGQDIFDELFEKALCERSCN